jgi:hypothetical protein
MIIFGSKAVHLKTVKCNLTNCTSCSTKGSINISVFRKHFHVFWIPMFPLWKTGVSECSHCKKVMRVKEMPDNLKLEFENLKGQSKGPIWQFSGLILLVVLILGVKTIQKNGSEKYQKEKQEYFASPMKGDVYEYVIKTGKYTTLKVVNISKDSISFLPNRYESNSIIRLSKINKVENYSDKPYSISKDKLKIMFNKGLIMGVQRK